MIRPVRTLARWAIIAACASAAAVLAQAQTPSQAQVEPEVGATAEVSPPPVDFAVSAHFFELGGADQTTASTLGYEPGDTVWRKLWFEPGETLIGVKVGEIIPAPAIGSGPRVPISGFVPRAAKVSDAWGVMLASSPVAEYDALPAELQAQALALGYSAGGEVVFTAADLADPHLVLFDPCTGPTIKVRLTGSRKRFEMHMGRMEGFQQFAGCALYDELHRKVQAEVARHGYGQGDRVMLIYDSSQDSTSVVPHGR